MDRAGAMRAIAPRNVHVCPRQGRRRPTPLSCAAGEVTDFPLVEVYGLQMILLAPGSAARGPRRGFMPQALAA
jgi:hypothetical protein